jgi:hypothetical protein
MTNELRKCLEFIINLMYCANILEKYKCATLIPESYTSETMEVFSCSNNEPNLESRWIL